jgi:elongator complex protein 3
MREIKALIKEIVDGKIRSKRKLELRKKELLGKLVKDSEILALASKEEKEKIRRLLLTKPVRTISGIAVVAVMTKPLACPKDKPCIYCPGGPSKGVPQSYTGKEPATMRALHSNYDPYLQVKNRLKQYFAIGHTPEKVELIIMGGTFTSFTLDYQEWFVKQCLLAMNRYPKKKPTSFFYLEEIKKRNERARIRCVGLTIETRPDWAKQRQANRMLGFGATRVELGVQSIYDDVLKKVERGHEVSDVIQATRILKDCGFKVCYHLMPFLPGSSPQRDFQMFKEIFSNSNFRPDELKIYPTLVCKGTKLYDWWEEGKYKAPTSEECIELLSRVKAKLIPKWVRIKRVTRDIPISEIVAGPKRSNLRELIWERMRKLGKRCSCIRCREVGHAKEKLGIEPSLKEIKLLREDYEASEGREIFLSFEDREKNILIGFLRLRIPSEHREELSNTALVRELHIYGPLVPLGKKGYGWQHRGYGKRLLLEAERISREEFDKKKLLILSGIGAKDYYRKLGYREVSFYMGKRLK